MMRRDTSPLGPWISHPSTARIGTTVCRALSATSAQLSRAVAPNQMRAFRVFIGVSVGVRSSRSAVDVTRRRARPAIAHPRVGPR